MLIFRADTPSSKGNNSRLCCGNGIIALGPTRRGYNVEGVDITHSYIKSAQDKASKAMPMSILFVLMQACIRVLIVMLCSIGGQDLTF